MYPQMLLLQALSLFSQNSPKLSPLASAVLPIFYYVKQLYPSGSLKFSCSPLTQISNIRVQFWSWEHGRWGEGGRGQLIWTKQGFLYWLSHHVSAIGSGVIRDWAPPHRPNPRGVRFPRSSRCKEMPSHLDPDFVNWNLDGSFHSDFPQKPHPTFRFIECGAEQRFALRNSPAVCKWLAPGQFNWPHRGPTSLNLEQNVCFVLFFSQTDVRITNSVECPHQNTVTYCPFGQYG